MSTNYHLKNQRKISLLSSKRAAFNYYIQHFHEGTTSSVIICDFAENNQEIQTDKLIT